MTLTPASLERLLGDEKVSRLARRYAAIKVNGLRRLDGGNARLAWSAALSCQDAQGQVRAFDVIVLGRAEPGQISVEASTEYAVLSVLDRLQIQVPTPYALDFDGSMAGIPAIVLQRLPGTASLSDFRAAGNLGRRRESLLQVADCLADVHAVPISEFDQTFEPNTGFGEHLAYWDATFRSVATKPVPGLAWVYRWLREHLPADDDPVAVHGDIRPGNFLVDNDELTGVLDWEMAHAGNRLEDLTWMYRHTWTPEQVLSFDDFLARYEQRACVGFSDRDVRYFRVFSEAKFATISLAASFAFHERGAANLRLADRAALVPESLTECLRWMTDSAVSS